MHEIKTKILDLLRLNEKVIIAIDGKCASGKSTFAEKLKLDFKAQIIHMDDYFLTPKQRTVTRLKETGGNLDYERFYNEIIVSLMGSKNFETNPFDCKINEFLESSIVVNRGLIIIEGSYAMRKEFCSIYNLKIFIDIDDQLQSKRILTRNGEDMHRRFMNEWIPKENIYIEEFQIKEKCDFVLNQDDIIEF